ncbi:MAG: Transcriptional regulatory protein AfsQ1 [Verrucomicrobiota bacterium]|jgi:CheY-like chemotaxis protein
MSTRPPATILAIDDSLTIRKLVDLILKGAGYNVILADKGVAGLKLAQEHKPDLILLDYVLPDLPSTEICKQLLADPATASIPILLISTNGAAIRQLYTDSRNVKDYLTKPFQAKVLQSVIAHLLSRRAVVENSLADVEPVSPRNPTGTQAPLAAEAGATPAGSLPASAANPSLTSPGFGPPPPAPRSTNTRAGAGHAAAATNDANAYLRNILNTRFRVLARMIPDLETRRGTLAPETYYLPFLLRNEVIADIAAELGRSQFAAEAGEPLLTGTADWMAIDATLLHLGRANASGVFCLRLPNENIDVTLRGGEVVSITSDQPKLYCAGAALNFRALPAQAIAAAVAAQSRSKTPFFISLHRSGVLRDPSAVLSLLRQQGARALHRAITTPGVRYAFIARDNSPDPGSFALGFSPRQAVLEALRFVDDWLEIESTTGSIETVFRLAPGAEIMLGELNLTDDERLIATHSDGRRSLQDVAAAAGLGIYETCAAVYRLLRLQLVAVETAVAPVADTSVQDFLSETAPADEWAAPFPTTHSRPAFSIQPQPKPVSSPTPWPKF